MSGYIIIGLLGITACIILIVLSCLYWGFLCFSIAEGKGKGTTLAFWLGFFFGPLTWFWYICQPQAETLHKLYPDKYDEKGKLIKKK